MTLKWTMTKAHAENERSPFFRLMQSRSQATFCRRAKKISENHACVRAITQCFSPVCSSLHFTIPFSLRAKHREVSGGPRNIFPHFPCLSPLIFLCHLSISRLLTNFAASLNFSSSRGPSVLCRCQGSFSLRPLPLSTTENLDI